MNPTYYVDSEVLKNISRATGISLGEGMQNNGLEEGGSDEEEGMMSEEEVVEEQEIIPDRRYPVANHLVNGSARFL